MSALNCPTSKELAAIIDERGPMESFFQARWFSNTIFSEKDEVVFDIIDDDDESMADFVACCVPGNVVKDRNQFRRASFTPPRMAPKSMVNPCTEKNVVYPGEINGGEFTDDEKLRRATARISGRHQKLISKRIEWMAAKAVIDGQYWVRGDHVESTLVDFGRDADHTVTLAGNALWTDVASTPVEDLENWGTTMFQAKGGSKLADVLMGRTAYNAFRKHQDVKDLLDKDVRDCDESNCVTQGPAIVDEKSVTLVGRISGVNIWLYKSYYTDENGVKQNFLQDNEVVLVGEGLKGYTIYGAISDLEQMGAVRLFQKTWTEPDPSGMCLLSQSRPMPVIVRPNSSFKATVVA